MSALITLYQLAWTASEYSPDGSPYGTQEEAEAARFAAARHIIGDYYDGDTMAQAVKLNLLDVTPERLAQIEDMTDSSDPTLTDEECVAIAGEYRDFEASVYAVSVALPSAPTESPPAALDGLKEALAFIVGPSRAGDIVADLPQALRDAGLMIVPKPKA